MRVLLVSLVLTAAMSASAVHAQDARGHIAYTGSSVDFGAGQNSTTVMSWGYVYEFNGFGSSWTRIHRPPSAPEGLGVTTLADGRRCFYRIEAQNLREICESHARMGDWGPEQAWPQPVLTATSRFLFSRIAVLGPANQAGAAAGQIPMIFAISSNSNQLLLRQYRNGAWGNWQRVASLLNTLGGTQSLPLDVSAAWEPANCAAPQPVAIINITTGRRYHRLSIVAGTPENSAPLDLAFPTPVRETVTRMAPLPSGCSDVQGLGYSVYVTESGLMYWSEASKNLHLRVAQMATPAPVRAIHARGQPWLYRLYMVDFSGSAWTATINTATSEPTNPAWQLME